MWVWGALIVLVGVLNLWSWISGDAGRLALVGAVVQLAIFILLITRVVHGGRDNRSPPLTSDVPVVGRSETAGGCGGQPAHGAAPG